MSFLHSLNSSIYASNLFFILHILFFMLLILLGIFQIHFLHGVNSSPYDSNSFLQAVNSSPYVSNHFLHASNSCLRAFSSHHYTSDSSIHKGGKELTPFGISIAHYFFSALPLFPLFKQNLVLSTDVLCRDSYIDIK